MENRSNKSYRPYIKTKKTKIFAVAGNPVLHSRSPEIFNAAFKAVGLDAFYTRLGASSAEEVIRTAKEMKLAGLNITSPFKEKIIPFLEDMDDSAARVNAVNTVVARKGRYKGYNTDVAGVVRAFSGGNVRLSGRKAAVIGAGGAAKAAACALLSEGAEVVVYNRTIDKAKILAQTMGCTASALENINDELGSVQILVSCLPFSGRIVEPRRLRQDMAVLDANYSAESSLSTDARDRGCKVIDGREWLLFQGAEAFRHLTGIEPPLPVMRKALYLPKPAGKTNIALIGFMGTGKSTVARSVSQMGELVFVDIDRRIEEKAESSIAEIFEKKGETAFRRMERGEIGKIPDISGTAIACGGGAVLSGINRGVLRKHCIVIWLWTGIDTILGRTGRDGTRPLLRARRGISRIKSLLKQRLPYYARASHMIVRTDGGGPAEIAGKIYEETAKFLNN